MEILFLLRVRPKNTISDFGRFSSVRGFYDKRNYPDNNENA